MGKVILGVLFIALCIFVVFNLSNTDTAPTEVYYPDPTGYVIDTANIISPEVEQLLTAMIKESTHEIAVVTVESTKPLNIEEYSIKLAEKLQVGDKDKDDGVILLIASEDRKIRIEVGYGLEGVLNDAKAGRILDEYIVPHLKNNDWDTGITAGIREIIKTTNN